MGRINHGIPGALFTRTQWRVLGILFNDPDRAFHLSEMLRLAGTGSGAVRRELERLVGAGLLERWKVGNQVHFRASAKSPVFAELCALIQRLAADAGAQPSLRAGSVAPICRRHAVTRLSVFGSAVRGDANAASDLDFIVEFAPRRTPTLAGLSALKDELETLYGRRVDLATTAILENPHRRRSIEKDMEVIYERKGSRVPVGHARGRQ